VCRRSSIGRAAVL